KETKPNREVPNPAESGPFVHGFPRAHGRPQASDDLLLHRRLERSQWQKRRREEHRQAFHHAWIRRNKSSPNSLSKAAQPFCELDSIIVGTETRGGQTRIYLISRWSAGSKIVRLGCHSWLGVVGSTRYPSLRSSRIIF